MIMTRMRDSCTRSQKPWPHSARLGTLQEALTGLDESVSLVMTQTSNRA
jgi:hypothetical protein